MEETKRPPVVKRNIWVMILLICYVFILSGGANYGFSRFLMALPFMLLALRISTRVLREAIYKKATFIIIIFSIFFSITLTKNPMAFPILNGGHVEIISDGFQVTYSDGSGGFYHKKIEEERSFYDVTYKELRKGEKYKVTGIKIGHPDFSTKINLQTEIGQFSQSDYQGDSSEVGVVPNKEVYADWVQNLGFLMNWPVFFLLDFPVGVFISSGLLMLLVFGINRLPKS